MKKVILVIISVFCLVTTVYANEECFLGLSSDMDNPCKVLVNIENAEHIYGGSFILEYDNNTIEVIDCKEGSPLENITAIINKSYADDKIKLTWASANEVTYDEPILYIEFKAVDTNVDQTEICFSEVVLYDIDSNEAQCKTDKFLLTLPGNNRVTLPEYEENLVSRPTSGSSVSRYTVKFETNGGSEVENKTVNRNAVLEAPEAPTKDGFKFDGWFTDKELTTAYDFTAKVTKGFTLYAKWTEIEKEPEVDKPEDKDDPETTEWKNPFNDVKADDWFYANVQYVVENKLMNGVAVDEFAPNDTLTRAMLVTVLYRNAGEPAVNKSIPFADVDMGAYYASAVIWAKQNGIVNGVTETEFAPDANITREQIAAIMFRYAQYNGMDAVTLEENLHFDDASKISEYAVSAMNWAVGTGLMKGKSTTTINPKDNATRAEIAAILQRFVENIK